MLSSTNSLSRFNHGLRRAGGGRALRLACTSSRPTHRNAETSAIGSDQEHLQRSLDLGPAHKQAPNFEYVAVAFRSQLRSKRSKVQRRDGGVRVKNKGGIGKIFGGEDDGRGYRTLEVVSGDRRLLFEPASAATTEASAFPQAAVKSASVAGDAEPALQSRAPHAVHMRPGRSSTTAPGQDKGAQRSPEQQDPLQHQRQQRNMPPEDSPEQLHLHVQGGQQQQPHATTCNCSNRNRSSRGRRAAVAVAVPADTRLAAAAALLQLPAGELRRHRGFCSELRALEGLGPATLAALRNVLVDLLGLTPSQLCAVLLRQPHVMRVPAAALARRGAALALELQLPPPPGPGGGGPLAEIVAAAPDVLLRRAGYAGTCNALATGLLLQPHEALQLLRREPQLLRHPPGFYARAVAQLTEQLGLQPAVAATLAAAEPQLLAVSPGVLRANGALLRSSLQLSPGQLADLVTLSPELMVRSPGELRAAVRRLTGVLSGSAAWRVALPRLLASPRNLAVALSFGSDRYDRLEYLAATGRDRIIGFKQGLSMEEEEFREVFPEYEYNVWRQVLPPGPAHPHPQPRPQPQPAHARGEPRMRV